MSFPAHEKQSNTPAKMAHIAVGIFILAFLIQTFIQFIDRPGLIYVPLTVYVIGAILGIVTLMKNFRTQNSARRLSIFGYIEVGLAILPVVLAILIFAFYIFTKGKSID